MDAMQRLSESGAVRRLWARDGELFPEGEGGRPLAAEWMGWLGLASADDPVGEQIRDLAAIAEGEAVTDIVLLGMGGSSLAPLVIASVLARGPRHPRLHVLDTTAPATVLETLEACDATTTWVVVASKSGTTIEPLSLYAIFRKWMDARVVDEPAGRHFVAITDPGTPLEKLAADEGFRAVVHAPTDVGGRYSALTPFGLLPASLVQADVPAMLASAERMEQRCRAENGSNPALP
jgi:glucose-6-phosphate isomerase